MLPLVAGLMGGASSLVGSIFSADTSAQNTQAQIAAQEQMQTQSEQFNAGQVQQQEAFQTQMSNTAYQRASADMQKAGLNPMMMFGSGGAASSPSGAAASVGTPSVPMPQTRSPMAGVGEAVDRAVSSAISAKTFDKMTQEVANLQTQQALTAASTATEEKRPGLLAAETASKDVDVQTKNLGLSEAQLRSKSAQDILSMPDWLRSGLNIGAYGGSKVSDTIAPILNSATSAGRVGQAFEAMKNSRLGRKIDEGNFVGKYGTPVDEYLAN